MKQNVLFLCSTFGLGGTEKTAYIYMKYLKEYYKVSASSIFQGGKRLNDFLNIADDVLVAEGNYQRIKNFIEKQKIDIIYMHGVSQYKNSYELIEFLKWSKGKHIKLIETSPFSIHSPETEQFLDYKLFVSRTSLLKFLWKFKNPSVTHYDYLYNPVDMEVLQGYCNNNIEKIKNREQYGIGESDFVLGKVGRADVVKWDDMIIDIVPLLKDKIKNLKIVIRSLPDFKIKKIKKLGIEKYFILLPETVDESEIANTYQLMDIMVHSSRIGESFGVALVEGMFFGLPILTTSTDWSQELLFDKDNSQYEILGEHNQQFISNDKRYIANKIIELYNNPSLLNEIGNKNKEFSLRYSAENQIEKLISILEGDYKNGNINNLKQEYDFYKRHCIKESLRYRLNYGIKGIYEMSFKKNYPFN